MSAKNYFKEVYTELVHKVTWPTWDELQNSAIIVMITSLMIAIAVGLMDTVFKNVMQFVYKLFY